MIDFVVIGTKIKFKVFNDGISGTNTVFILFNLKKNLDKYNPDMVNISKEGDLLMSKSYPFISLEA